VLTKRREPSGVGQTGLESQNHAHESDTGQTHNWRARRLWTTTTYSDQRAASAVAPDQQRLRAKGSEIR